MKLLLIDDNIHLVDRVCRHFRNRFIIDHAASGKQAIDKIADNDYALILLDLHLPDMKGLEVCVKLREKGVATPILVLSGNGEVSSKIDLLKSGADDYVVKPFHPQELLARIEAILRRNVKTYEANLLSIDDLVLDTHSRKVQRGGQKITLRRKEFDILEYLLYNKGRAVTRDMILNHVWEEGKSGWHNTVDVHVKYLRDKVDRPFPTKLIKTAYGIGYMVDDST